jgi:hypothetical protein
MPQDLKLFLWKNSESLSDFTEKTNIDMPESSNAHSGGTVVIAESKEEALELLKPYIKNDKGEVEEWHLFADNKTIVNPEPVVLSFDKKGIVIYCSGDC